MKNRFRLCCILVVLCIGFLLRFNLLGVIPAGLTNDEADIGYDSYSLLQTGKDQWGETLPLTAFKGFGDYRLPLYTYLILPFVAIFDLSVSAVRLPSAIFGTISLVLIYLVARKLFEKQRYAHFMGLFSMLIMAISPWSIGLSRIGIESNVAISFFLMGFLLFLNYKKRPYFLLSSFIFFALCVYTYTSYAFFVPITIFILFLFYRKELMRLRKTFLLGIFLLVLITAPLFFLRSAAGVRISQVSFINSTSSIGILTNLDERRGSCGLSLPPVVCKFAENKPTTFTSIFVSNYLNHFSFSFLFINGTSTQYSTLPLGGLFYSVEIIFLIIGLIGFLRNRLKQGLLVVVLLLVSVVPDSITGDGHYSRASAMMPFIFLVEGFGAVYGWSFLSKYKKTRIIASLILGFVILFSFGSFVVSYFTYFPQHYSVYSQYGYEDLTQKLIKNSHQYSKIYVSRYGNDTKQYIYYLFYSKYSPEKFQKKTDVIYTDNKGWVSIDMIGDIHYVDVIPSFKELKKMNVNALIITHPSELPKDYVFFDAVKNKKGDRQFVFTDRDSLLKYYKKNPSSIKL